MQDSPRLTAATFSSEESKPVTRAARGELDGEEPT
jgi:hypothetical protein